MSTVATMHECPTCREGGKTALMSADIMKNTISCESGHTFPIDEFEAGLAMEVQPPPVMAPPPPPSLQMSIEELPETPSPTQQPAPIVEAEVSIKKAEPAKLTFKAEPEAAPAATNQEFQVLPGGNVRVSIVIPENDWMGIKAEAENQRQTPVQYFQEQIERGLSFRWFY